MEVESCWSSMQSTLPLALACISRIVSNCFAKFGGYFEEKNVLRNMRNIVINRAKFISFWAPEKNSREMWLYRAKFSYGGLVTSHWPIRF